MCLFLLSDLCFTKSLQIQLGLEFPSAEEFSKRSFVEYLCLFSVLCSGLTLLSAPSSNESIGIMTAQMRKDKKVIS